MLGIFFILSSSDLFETAFGHSGGSTERILRGGFVVTPGHISGHFTVNLRCSTSCPHVPLLSLAELLSHISAITLPDLLRLGLL